MHHYLCSTTQFPTDRGSIKLAVKAVLEHDTKPAKFEATGEVQEPASVAKGASYALMGWAFPGKDGKVARIVGSVRAVRGSDAQPDKELGGMPIGTVGMFIIVPESQD